MKKNLKILLISILSIISLCIFLGCNDPTLPLDNSHDNTQSGTATGTVDTDGDGIADGTAIDTNGDGSPDGVDTNGDGVIDVEWSDSYSILYYSVTYNGNGKESGTIPQDSTNYIAGATVTVLGNNGNLTLTDCDFKGWNTKADGSGTSYKSGETFSIGSANVLLYAQWERRFDIYVGGYQSYAPTYWKNGEEGVNLKTDSITSYCYSIFVDDDEKVHAAGWGKNSSGVKTARYWDGTGSGIFLTDGSTESKAYSVAVYKGIAYVAGYEKAVEPYYNETDKEGELNQFARLWKIENGNVTKINIAKESGDDGEEYKSYARAIFIDDSGLLYVAGHENNAENPGKGYFAAKYWTYNEGTITETTLANGTSGSKYSANAYGITVTDGVVYVCGRGKGGKSYNYADVTRYWKDNNGTVTETTLVTETPANQNCDSEGYSICVNQEVVYVAGGEKQEDSSVDVKYWTDNDGTISQTILSEEPEGYYAFSILVYEDAVHVAGQTRDNSTVTATYWRDGKETLLSSKPSSAWSLFLVKKN
ncbi:MAG: InlB B-repeat-containing protein [Spirochaetales bacterium]|nr:InlB B-repeat-containing protein [Spirochaetales bacterium]